MKPLQIFNPVIDHFDLFFHHRHTPGEMVVFPDFPGQFVQFGFRHCLISAIGNDNAQQCNAPGDERCQNGLHCSHPLNREYCPMPTWIPQL